MSFSDKSSQKNVSITSFFRTKPKAEYSQDYNNQISLFVQDLERQTPKNEHCENPKCKIEESQNDYTKLDTTASEPDFMLTQNDTPNKTMGLFIDDDLPLSRKRSLLFEEDLNPPKHTQNESGGLDSYQFREDRHSESLTVGKEDKKDKEDCIDYSEREMYMNCKASKMSQAFREYVDNYYRYKGTFTFPPWIEVKNIRDIDGNRPTDDDYKPNTLWIPPKNHKWAYQFKSGHYTECMQQWWNIKQNHFDSLVFFKMGRFYELFYHDACILQNLVNLRWMGSETKPHVGFPEKSLHTYAKACVNSGYKVVVVEQTETPQQLEKRNKESGSYDRTVKRDVCEIITAGTVTRPEMLDRQSRPLVFVSLESEDRMSLISIDVSMSKMLFGCLAHLNQKDQFDYLNHSYQPSQSTQHNTQPFSQAGHHFSQLKTILVHLCPAEIVLDRHLMENQELVKMIKVLPYAPELTSHYNQQFTSATEESGPNVATKSELYVNSPSNKLNLCTTSYGEEHLEANSLYRRVLSEYPAEANDCKHSLMLADSYLKFVLMDKLAEYCYIEPLKLSELEVMNMDYSALTHLELFHTQEGSTKNSLFDYLNNTVTSFGERLLRSWLLNPLTDVDAITARSECVAFLLENYPLVTTIKQDLHKFPDLERSLGKVLNTASNLHKKAVYFDEGVFTKLYELHTMLDRFKRLEDVVVCFFNEAVKMFNTAGMIHTSLGAEHPRCSKSKLIAELNEHFISCAQDVYNFKGTLLFTEEKKCRSKNWQKSEAIQAEIDKVANKLNQMLLQIQQAAPSATFVNCKFRYEVEMTETEFHRYNRMTANSMEITSTRSGFVRARNARILELIDELEEAEFRLKESEEEFYQQLVRQFHKGSYKFCKLIEVAAMLDCLCSLATVARNSAFPMTRPKLHPKSRNVLKLKDSVYPLFTLNNNNSAKFVPNDVCFGSFEESGTPIVIITGPNMGGKSTLLRQIALTVIMGQMGSFVSATSCEFSIVDSVFTRLGASDNLAEGKSTFLVELQDISNILSKATGSSLALIDELGRGTSTFDGTAIAVATLEKISKIGCRCVFTTHFQDVCTSAKEFRNVSMFHMAARVDEQEQSVEFLYKLVPGICPDSHGLHVAKLAKIPDHVLKMARSARLRLKANANRNGVASNRGVDGGAYSGSTGSSNEYSSNDYSSLDSNECKDAASDESKRLDEEKYEKIAEEILKAHQSGNVDHLHDIYIKYSV